MALFIQSIEIILLVDSDIFVCSIKFQMRVIIRLVREIQCINKIKLKVKKVAILSQKQQITLMTSFGQQQMLRATQLVEDYHPVIRRRALTSIRASFPTFFSSEDETSVISMNESQKIIYQNFNKINQIIDIVDDHIRRRIECYQNEVVNVVQKQIQQMREETQKVVTQFNSMIQEKNKENQIYSLNNELDYFKSEAKKLFDLNKQLRKENFEAKKKMQEYEWELENREVIMQKLWYKYQKEKFNKDKLKTKVNTEVQSIQKDASNRRKQSNPQIKQLSHKDIALQIKSIPLVKLGGFQKTMNLERDELSVQIRESPIRMFQQNIPEQQDNSLLIIDYEQESGQSQISFKGKSITLTKPQLRDQESQANIYLSELSYKSLFQNKAAPKNNRKATKEIAIQTENNSHGYNTEKKQTQTRQSSTHKSKSINFMKNGFIIQQAPTNHGLHHRTKSNYFSSIKRESMSHLKQMRKDKERIHTETNFNSRKEQEFGIELVTPKPVKNKSKLFHKMAHKFQRSKIIERAYEKGQHNKSQEK